MEYVVLPSSLYSPQFWSATPRIGNLARAFGFAIIMFGTAVSAPLFGPRSDSSVRPNLPPWQRVSQTIALPPSRARGSMRMRSS